MVRKTTTSNGPVSWDQTTIRRGSNRCWMKILWQVSFCGTLLLKKLTAS